MRRASHASGAERSAFDRRIDPRELPGVRAGSLSDVEAACRRIAEYLIAVSREERLEPALHEFMRTFDLGRQKLDAASLARTEEIYEAVFRREIDALRERRRHREPCDPHFWG